MSDCKIILDVLGERIWINPRQIVKMVKNTMGKYIIFMITGETFEVDHRTASSIEDFFKEVQ